MKWFFHTDGVGAIQLIATFESGPVLGDLRRTVEKDGNFFGVTYAAMREAKAGTIEVDEDGKAELLKKRGDHAST